MRAVARDGIDDVSRFFGIRWDSPGSSRLRIRSASLVADPSIYVSQIFLFSTDDKLLLSALLFAFSESGSSATEIARR